MIPSTVDQSRSSGNAHNGPIATKKTHLKNQAVHTQTGQQTYGYVSQVNSAINSKSLQLIPRVVRVVSSAVFITAVFTV